MNRVCSNLAALLVAAPLAATAAEEHDRRMALAELHDRGPCMPGRQRLCKDHWRSQECGDGDFLHPSLLPMARSDLDRSSIPKQSGPTTPDFSRRTRTGRVSTDARLRKSA